MNWKCPCHHENGQGKGCPKRKPLFQPDLSIRIRGFSRRGAEPPRRFRAGQGVGGGTAMIQPLFEELDSKMEQ
jgi:hypothetical protein